jgi:hypothetical protein
MLGRCECVDRHKQYRAEPPKKEETLIRNSGSYINFISLALTHSFTHLVYLPTQCNATGRSRSTASLGRCSWVMWRKPVVRRPRQPHTCRPPSPARVRLRTALPYPHLGPSRKSPPHRPPLLKTTTTTRKKPTRIHGTKECTFETVLHILLSFHSTI